MGQHTSTARQNFKSNASAQRRVEPFLSSDTEREGDLYARPYWPRIPDGEYLAVCKRTYWDRKSRSYGERIYVYLRIFEGEHAGIELRMICRPSTFPTSNYYRAWAIAHGGPPRSRNTKMSLKIFEGKLYRVRVVTVKPRHRVMGPDGKVRQGDPLPEHLWYSKVDCLLSLEATNAPIGDFSPPAASAETSDKTNGAPPLSVTEISRNPFSQQGDPGGGGGVVGVGSGELGARGTGFSGRGEQSTNAPPPAGGGGDSAVGHTPSDSRKQKERAPPSQAPRCGREHLERAIFRTKLFQAHDAMSPKFGLARCIEKLVCEAAHYLCMDRACELEGVSEEALVEKALARLKAAIPQFEAIRDAEKQRYQIVACVVNAVVDAALAARSERGTARPEVLAQT